VGEGSRWGVAGWARENGSGGRQTEVGGGGGWVGGGGWGYQNESTGPEKEGPRKKRWYECGQGILNSDNLNDDGACESKTKKIREMGGGGNLVINNNRTHPNLIRAK